MLDSQDTKIALQFKNRLAQITSMKQFVVFGSRARGTATEDSDLDVFIEVPTLSSQLRRLISETAWEIGLENNVVISTLVATPFDIQYGLFGANPILSAIMKEGVPV
jgi:predicted nucleotidyltransferase